MIGKIHTRMLLAAVNPSVEIEREEDVELSPWCGRKVPAQLTLYYYVPLLENILPITVTGASI